MPITVEFFGIPRSRAGVDRITVNASTLGGAFHQLADRLPGFAEGCLVDGRLAQTFLVNRNGREFLRDVNESLTDGDSLLILSADVGG